MKRTKELTASDWTERTAFFLDYLLASDPLVKATAYGEIERAPYPAMREAMLGEKHRLEVGDLLRAFDQATEKDARSLLILLLGLGDSEAARDWIGQELERRQRRGEAENLAALLTAWLEFSGGKGLQRIRELYTARTRAPDEVHNMIVALTIHGDRRGGIPVDDIIPIFRETLHAHPDAAGYIAKAMDGWSRWDLAGEMTALKDDARVDEGSKLLLMAYLRSSKMAER